MKRNINILSIIMILGLANSCSLANAPSTSTDDFAAVLLKKPIEGDSISFEEYSNNEFQLFLQNFNHFSAKFSEKYCLMNPNDENISISPLSVYMALSLAGRCTANNTQKEILQALNLKENEITTNIKTFYKLSNREYSEYTINNQKEVISLEKITNSLWFDNDLQLNEDCLEDLCNNYYCYPYQVDFDGFNLLANQAIKEFVKEQTKGKIDNDFHLTEQTVMAIINTLYLKDIWNNEGLDLPFSNNQFEFENANHQVFKTLLLQGDYKEGKVFETETFTHFYTSTYHNYKIKFIVPKDGYQLKEVFTQENIEFVQSIQDYHLYDEILKERYYTRCLFPEFKAKCNKDLKTLLYQEFGIKDIFSPNKADFSHISEINQMYCDSLVHQTCLEVKKEGIEGAAVTILSNCESAEPDIHENIYQDFIVDKAFGYILCDPYDIPLFTGMITSLSKI